MSVESRRRTFQKHRAALLYSLALLFAAPSFAEEPLVGVAPNPVASPPNLEVGPGLPVLNGLAVSAYESRPGAPYTLYLDFGGFTFNGLWGGQGNQVPGTTPAYTVDSNATAFTATELANIKIIWSRVAEKYSAFNVNVTTIDPAAAAGQAANDTQRQSYYDTHSRVMHTVIGGGGGWTGGGGVSYIGVANNAYTGTGFSNGYHTNWVFSAQAPSNLQFVAEASAHEDGHGLNLYHQSDYNGNTLVNEYSSGTGTGSGSKAPIMGNSYSAERGLWKIGPSHINNGGPTNQNDPSKIMSSNSGLLPWINDGIGHTLQTATPLPLNGLAVDFNLAKGVIVPTTSFPSSTAGSANYTSDYWSFSTGAGLVTLSVNAGRQSINPGFSDPGAMLDASLPILDTAGTVLHTSATSALSQALSVNLAAGNYVARVYSAGDPLSLNFYDMGSYFLKGTVAAVPEPTAVVLILVVVCSAVLCTRQRRQPMQSHAECSFC